MLACSFFGIGVPGFASSCPTAQQMSSPTMSASSMGPMGMPKSFAAASIVSPGTPSSSMSIASMR